ncbi:MAG: LVIVD repeat-containing protein [Thermoanaerobaculia bacterium]
MRGSLAYAADGRGVSVYDISDPAAIHAVHIESRDAETFDAAFMGDRDLVTATATGVERFTLADDGTLALTGFLAASRPVSIVAAGPAWGAAATGRDVTLFEPTSEGTRLRATSVLMMQGDVIAMTNVGEYLYVAVDRRGTYVFRPPSTEQIGFVPQTANDFELAGKILWGSAPAGGIAAFDVTDPTTPRRIAVSMMDTQFNDVAASGTRVYALSNSGDIQVFNASSPAAPKPIDTIADHAETIAATSNLLIASRPGAPLRLFDGAGIFAGELADYAGPVRGVWTNGSLAYVVDPPFLRVIDVSKTEDPRELSAIEVPRIQNRIRVKNGLAVLYGSALVNLIDVSDALHPRYLGTWDTQGTPPSNAAIAAGTVIEANAHSGLHVVDYTDPAHAVQIGGRIWHYYDMAAADDVIYALMDGYFLVLQIVDGRVIVERKTETVHTGTFIEVSPPNANVPEYVLTRSAEGVRVYDVRDDRFETELLGEIPFENAGVIATGNGVAYVAAGGTLHEIDLPSLNARDTEMVVTDAMQISVAGEKVVVADHYRLRVFGPDTESPVPPPAPPRRRAVGH